MKRYLLPTLILFCMMTINTMGQEMHFRHYDNKDGLSHNTVFCALQDKNGFMWFGTNEGLDRFDGYEFKVYEYDRNDSLSIIQNRVNSMCEASDGKIWMCTEDGVCTYNPETDSFHPFYLTKYASKPAYFRHIVEDCDKNMWMIGDDCIVRHDPLNKNSKIFSSEEFFSPVAINISSGGYPILADSLSLWKYSKSNDSFVKIPVLNQNEVKKGNKIYTIRQLPNKQIAIGTLRGLLILDETRQKITNLIPDVTINALEMQNQNKCWIGTEDGLYIYDLFTKEMRHSRYTTKNTLSIKDNSIYDICRDSEGGMWLVGYFGGISYFPNRNTDFNFLIDDNGEKIIDANTIREITVDNSGDIWIGSEDNGLFRYNPTTKEVVNYSTSTNRQMPDNNIQGLLVDDTNLWVGTVRNGLVVIDIPSGKIIRSFNPENTNWTLDRRHIQSLYKTSEGHILAGTDVGIYEYIPSMDRWNKWNEINYYIRQIYEDTDGDLWFVTGSGLFKKDNLNGAIDRIDLAVESPLIVESNNLTSIFEDSCHRLWITSGNGFVKYNKNDNSTERITRKDGLPSNFTFRIEEENSGKLWISTAAGLVRYDPESGSMDTYDYDNDLLEIQFNYNSSCRLPDGTLFFGTLNNGLVYFLPENFIERQHNPNLFITKATTLYSDSEQKEINPEERNQISYRSTLTIFYVGINFTSPDGLYYEYKLLPLNDEWIPVQKRRDITFANLSPGKYTFCIRSREGTMIHQNEKRMEFNVKPPILLSKAAYAVYFILLFLSVTLIIFYKQRQQRKDFELKNVLFETKKEKELYDEKMKFFSEIVHEIRTPLTLIKAPLEKITKSPDMPEKFNDELSMIDRNTDRLLTISNQMLDFKRVDCENFSLTFHSTDMILFMKDVLKGFQPLLEEKNLSFNFSVETESLIADISPEDFRKIVSNLMFNAIKYSKSKIEVKLYLDDQNRNDLVLDFSNDGEVIPEEERTEIFKPFFRSRKDEFKNGSGIGLSIVQSLVSMHAGTISYLVDPVGYNTFKIKMPLHNKTTENINTLNREDSIKAADEQLDKESSGYTILIVEDNKEMREFLRNELSDNFKVIEAEDGIDAIEKLNQNFINLIICDLMMPRMDGFEFCRKVKTDVRFSQIPFIILTAINNLNSRIKTLEYGADAYIEKPFSTDLLKMQIKNLLHTREKIYEALKRDPAAQLTNLSNSPLDDEFLRKLNDYINENISIEHMNMDNLASAMNMSYISLYRKIKVLTGMAPLDYVKIFRLKKAAELLLHDDVQIQEICYQVGFSSPAYFSSCFSKYFKKSPTEYIKESKSLKQ